MILIRDIAVHTDIFKEYFICDLKNCNGICCVEGDYGAPLEEEEIKQIEENLDWIKLYMTQKGLQVLKKHGFYEKDEDAELVTTCIKKRDCLFSYKSVEGFYKCAIETAWENEDSYFQKPISCHLYPIRINSMRGLTGMVYNRWDICKSACELGEREKLPLYKFLKDPLIRKYGIDWYNELVSVADDVIREF